MNDRAMLYITTSMMANKIGNLVSENIKPDYIIKKDPGDDRVLAEAKKWGLQNSK